MTAHRLSWRDYLKQPNPIASALMAKMKMSPQERPRVKLECLRLMTTLKLDRARMRLISGFVDTYLRLTAEEELTFRRELAVIEPKEQETIMELTTSWEEKGLQRGLQQGLQQGLEQGKQQEAVALVLRLLTRRFGAVRLDAQERITHLPLAQLEELSEALLDFTGPEDLMRWLGERQSSGGPGSQ